MAEITVFYEGPLVTRTEAKARDLARYFTGKPCKRGHITERSVKDRGCLGCRQLRQRTDPDYAAYQKQYRRKGETEDRKRYLREYQRTRYHQDAEYRARQLRWGQTEARKEYNREYMRQRRQTDEFKTWYREYLKSEGYRRSFALKNARRRARKQGASGKFTAADYRRLLEIQKRCHICGRLFTKADPPTIDHVIALADDGRNDPSNVALAHGACNFGKGPRRTHLI